MVKTRGETKEETRRALLLAGREAFAEEGLDRPSLDGICARAGYTRGAFYVHFQDRDDFLVAVMEEALGEFLSAVVGADDDAADLTHTIDTFAAAITSGAVPMLREGAMQFHQLLAATQRSVVLKEKFVTMLGGAVSRMARAVRKAQSRGEARKGVAPEQVSTLLTSVALGLVVMVETGLPFDPAALRRTVLALVRSG